MLDDVTIKELLDEHASRYRGEYSPFKNYLKSIKRRQPDSMLTLKNLYDIWNLQNGICLLTGLEMSLPKSTKGQGKVTPTTATVDRIDRSQGYNRGNIRWITFMANICRNEFNDTDVIEFARAVVKHCGT
jgi:hypothetical protein